METVIKLRLSELTAATIEKLRNILRTTSEFADPELTILIESDLNEDNEYLKKLNASIVQHKSDETVSFTMEELTDYINTNFKQ